MLSILDTVQPTIDTFLNQARRLVSKGLDLSKFGDEFGKLKQALIDTLVAELDGDSSTSGSDKKQLILDAVGAMFDIAGVQLAAMIPLPLWLKPFWLLIVPILLPQLKAFLLKDAGGAIERALELIRGGKLKPV
jgi:hypothetical protein